MKILQIWINDFMPDIVKEYTNSVPKNTVGDYYFIGNKLNAPNNAIVLDPENEIEKAKSYMGNNEWWEKYNTKPMFISDMIRLSWACQHDDLLYVDADCILKYPINIRNKNKPNIAKIQTRFDFFLFYSGSTSWWKNFVDITIREPFIQFAFLKTFFEVLNKKRNLEMPEIISEQYYKHISMGGIV